MTGRKPKRSSAVSHRQFLMAQPMFERISGRSPAFRRFLEEVELLHYDKTEHIYRQGNPSTFLYLVRDGEVQIRQQRGEGQKPRIIGIHSRGSLFGEVSFLTGEAHSSDAIASLDSNVYRIRGELFVRLLSEEPPSASVWRNCCPFGSNTTCCPLPRKFLPASTRFFIRRIPGAVASCAGLWRAP
ncbi:MAG: cyclic nucleotide-binding domain-containing protein [Spirochaetales bacterium]|nr:cyclic nucleotide-binding domain-containing protein [Spirochaetales bacterium]